MNLFQRPMRLEDLNAEFGNGVFMARFVMALGKVLKKPKVLRELARELNVDVSIVEVFVSVGVGGMAQTVATELQSKLDARSHEPATVDGKN